MIESLIVSTVLILAIVSGLFFHRLYAAKLRVIREARVGAWRAANSLGCGGATIDLRAIVSEALSGIGEGSFMPREWVAAGITPGMAGGVTIPSFFGGVGHRAQSSSSVVASHAALGGASHSLRAAQHVACNEVVASARGDMLSIFGYAAKNLLGASWGGSR